MTILGISVGTSRTGVCVLRDGTLLERQVHDFPTQWSDTKLRIVLNRYRRYLHKYNVNAVVIKIPLVDPKRKALMRLIRRVEALAKEYECEYDLMTRSDLKRTYSLRSTDEIIKFTVRLYPELNPLYNKGILTSQAYYKKLYEAVLASHIYQECLRMKS